MQNPKIQAVLKRVSAERGEGGFGAVGVKKPERTSHVGTTCYRHTFAASGPDFRACFLLESYQGWSSPAWPLIGRRTATGSSQVEFFLNVLSQHLGCHRRCLVRASGVG